MSHKHTIEMMRSLARARGGTCLSGKYVSAHTPLEWRCADGHTWWAKPMNVKNREQWCPRCRGGYGEETCRRFLEAVWQTTFRKSRPEWLLSPNGGRMELDGYNVPRRLAFEYQGPQHYGVDGFFIQDGEAFAYREACDEAKRKLCRGRGILLIEIPAFDEGSDPTEYLRAHVAAQLVAAGRTIPTPLATATARRVGSRGRLHDLQARASVRGGECLARVYVTSTTAMPFRCAAGHEWTTTPASIRAGSWCPTCAGRAPVTLEMMREHARERGGRCLSRSMQNIMTPLRWRCAQGHTWTATGNSIRNSRSWCPSCAHGKRTIEEMQEMAAERGGTCLSKRYRNLDTKLRWRCAEGHEWRAMPSNVLGGSWCPTCALEGQRLGLDRCREKAAERGGDCLATEYVRSHAPIRWRCAAGHEWMATAGSVVTRGSWCAACAGLLPKTLADLRALAAERGGRCLSTRYTNSRAPIRWQCAKGHDWESSWGNVRKGAWCPMCATERLRLGLEEMQALAAKRGGYCLSTEYRGTQYPLEWQCRAGHVWTALPHYVKYGDSWCPKCASNAPRGLAAARALARARGGACLATDYVNNKTKLQWRCRSGHQWEAILNHVDRGSWCPFCAADLRKETMRRNGTRTGPKRQVPGAR